MQCKAKRDWCPCSVCCTKAQLPSDPSDCGAAQLCLKSGKITEHMEPKKPQLFKIHQTSCHLSLLISAGTQSGVSVEKTPPELPLPRAWQQICHPKAMLFLGKECRMRPITSWMATNKYHGTDSALQERGSPYSISTRHTKLLSQVWM